MKFIYPFILIFFAIGVSAEKLVIADFTKGLNKGISSTIAGEGYTAELINFEFDPIGSLTPRRGYYHIGFGADTSGRIVPALIGYNKIGDNQLLTTRRNNLPAGTGISFPSDRLAISKSDGTDSGFNVYFHAEGRYAGSPTTPVRGVHWLDNLFISSEQSEMYYYNGDQLVPVRPMGPGQPYFLAVDSGGNVNGNYRYRYSFYDPGGGEETNLSIPTWPVSVTDGKVYIHGFARCDDSATFTKIRIYRDDLSDTLHYFLLSTFDHNGDTDYIDNTASASSGAPTYPWGFMSRCYAKLANCSPEAGSTYVSVTADPPGAPSLVAGVLTTGPGCGDLDQTQAICNSLEYIIVYIDSAGRWSHGSPTLCARIAPPTAANIDSLKITMTNIPVPSDPHKIVKKYLLRRHGRDYLAIDSVPDVPEDYDGFYLLDTLHVDSTTYTDSLRIDSAVLNRPKFCLCNNATTYVIASSMSCYAGYEPHLYDCADDNLLTFQPSDMVLHNSRMFAIGDPLNRNTLYYSEFYNPTSWPFDKSLIFQSGLGDWMVKLHVLGEDLIMFRQNSIERLSGLSFFQFRAVSLTAAAGATSARSVAGNEAEVYFAHTTGIYRITPGSVPQKISLPIQSHWDSLTTDQIKNSVGAMKGDEYWLSYPRPNSGTVRNQTLIFHTLRNYFRVYDYPFDDITQYSIAVGRDDFDPDRYVLSANDSIYEFSDTTFGGPDTGGLVISTLKTKPLFDGPGRVKVNYIDIGAWGPVPDSITALFFENEVTRIMDAPFGGTDTTSASVVPDWTINSHKQTRLMVNKIVTSISIKLKFWTSGSGGVGFRRFHLKTLEVDYTPWDEGKL